MKVLLRVAILAIIGAGGFSQTDAGRFDRDQERFCSRTKHLMFQSCRAEMRDDHFSAMAKCVQVLDDGAREECSATADEERFETIALCNEQRRARAELCELTGEDRYDPNWDPADFVTDYSTNVPNPYYPLVIGHRWSFEAEDENNVIEVLSKTKFIEGVNCLVINDFVTGENGGEDTDDWYAQRFDGTVEYCGEEVQDFEMFAGDNPMEPEVVAIDGSFKHGRDGDLAGTIMPALPYEGQTYRQEMSLGNAEDSATILTTTYGLGDDDEIDSLVPRALVTLLCDDDCLITGEFTPVEPELFDLKFYSPGIGLFLELNLESGEINQLVECNFDPRCDSLPQP